MKITIVNGSLASNGILRMWIIAQLLGRHYEVEAIGRLGEGEEILPWCRDYDWKVVRAEGMVETMDRLERAITGDIVMASGIGMGTFGTALLAKRRRGTPVILDMGEWEVHDHLKHKSSLARGLMIARSLVGPGWSNPHSFKYRYMLDHLTGFADEKTVACTFLKQRYGGVVLPFCVDTAKFDPDRFDKQAVRRKWGVPLDATVLFFGGNPQPMKGLEEMIAALRGLGDRVNALLVIVGRDESHAYTRRLMEAAPGKVLVLGAQPFELMPELHSIADLVVLPQTNHPKSQGYIPAKIYEAMAMRIPVVSSAVSDIPSILEGCGYVIPPEDAVALQASIEHVLLHPDEAREMGRRSRERVIERYSWDVGERILQGVIEGMASRSRLARAA